MAKQRKKLSTTFKLVIVLAALAVVFFVFALVSAIHSVDRTIKAIDRIGTVEYTAECKQRIDVANDYYHSLDKNLGLQNRITNVNTLTEAKRKYLSRLIFALRLADEDNSDGSNNAQVIALIDEARATYESYFTTDESENIPNFRYLTEAEAKYRSNGGGTQSGSPSDDDQEDVELC